MPLENKISIFMPAYNAARHIENVINRIPEDIRGNIASIWIINDGSEDDTRKVIDGLARRIDTIKAVHFDKNRGYGVAVKKGLELSRDDGSDAAVCLHSDGQYPPEYIPACVETMKKKGYDILQGSRISSGTALSGKMPLYKFIANRALTFFENIVFRLKLTDYHSGFIFYSRRALDNIPFDRLSESFDFDVEVIACARTLGLGIGEHPIPTRYADEVSYLNPITYGFRILGVMFKYLSGHYRRLCKEHEGGSE